MWNWLIQAFPDTKSKIIAGLAVMVAMLGYMQIRQAIHEDTDAALMVVEEEVLALEERKKERIDALEERLSELEHKVDNIQNYAATGVWKAIQENKTQIEVLKNTKRDKK